jgi:gluconate 5-dehydrogenase
MGARFDLKGRTALVTGSAGHLGAPMVDALAEAGAHVILNGRNAGAIEAQRDRLKARGLSAALAPFDIMDEEARSAAIAKITRLDVLVNNAYTGRPGTIAMAQPEDFVRAFESGCPPCAQLSHKRAAPPS